MNKIQRLVIRDAIEKLEMEKLNIEAMMIDDEFVKISKILLQRVKRMIKQLQEGL